jgi:hypothetical protein
MRSKICGVFHDFFDFPIQANVKNVRLWLARKNLLSLASSVKIQNCCLCLTWRSQDATVGVRTERE